MTGPEQHAARFTGALLGGHGELLSGLHISLSSFTSRSRSPSTRLVAADPTVVARSIIETARTPGTTNVHIGVGLTRGYRAINPATNRHYDRLAVPDVDAIAWLWCDIDLAGKAHGDSPSLCPDEAAALSIVADTGLAPTATIRTGHGIQSHWRLAEPLIFGWTGDIDDDGHPVIDPGAVEGDRAKASVLAWDWVKSLHIRGQRLGGWSAHGTSDIARLIRPPGTSNYKLAIDNDVRRVEILECDPSRRYDLDQITAVLADRNLLDAHRYSTGDDSELAGVDMVGLWNAVKAIPDRTPELVRVAMEAEQEWGGGDLAALWSGAADARYGHNDSDIDIALARCVLHLGFTPADAAQAIMGRRLRIGRKTEKADPTPGPGHRGLYYLGITVGKAAATYRAECSSGYGDQGALEQLRTAVATLERPALVGPEIERIPPAPEQDAAPEQQPTPPSPLRAVPPDLLDPETEYADAPRAPRAGIDDPVPAPPDEAELQRLHALRGLLGLPEDVLLWGVNMRRLTKGAQIRVWCRRGEDAPVHGGRWPVGGLKASQWRTQKEWDSRAAIADHLFHDLHIVADPAREWRSLGRPLLYSLARDIPEGTPEEILRIELVNLIHAQPGTSMFSACCQSGEPWVTPEAVWLRVSAIRQHLHRGGFSDIAGGIKLIDLLAGLGCRIIAPLTAREGEDELIDYRQWVRLHPDIAPPAVWAVVRAQATRTDEELRRSRGGLRAVHNGDQP